jgi:hypothetical protein
MITYFSPLDPERMNLASAAVAIRLGGVDCRSVGASTLLRSELTKKGGTGDASVYYARARAREAVAARPQAARESAKNRNSDQLFGFAFRDHQR